MKTISLAVLASFLVLSGLAVASQSGEQKDHSSGMQEMMKGEKSSGGSMQGMSGMAGMMRMMKMMDQCAAMMESAQDSEAKESRNQ